MRAARRSFGEFDPYAPTRWARRVEVRSVPGFEARVRVRHGVSRRMLRALLLAMASYANPDGSSVHAAVATLADDILASPRQVRAALRALEAQGLIACTYRSAGRHTCRYDLILGPRPAPDPDGVAALPAPPSTPAQPGNALPRSELGNPATMVAEQPGNDGCREPALDPVPPLEGPPPATDEKDAPRGAAHRQMRAGCRRHPTRRRRNCRDCQATPAPPRYTPPPEPEVGAAARGMAAVREAQAAARTRSAELTNGSTRERGAE